MIMPTIVTNNRLCFSVKRNSSASRPTRPMAAQATAIDCGEIILPVTPPVVLAATIRMSETDLMRRRACSAPNRAFDDVSEPVRNTPSQPRNGEKNGNALPVPASSQGQRGGHAGVVGDEGEAQHHADREDRAAQVLQRFTEGGNAVARLHAQEHDRDDCGQQDRGTGGGNEVELVDCIVRLRRRDDRGDLDHQLVQAFDREVEDGRASEPVLANIALKGGKLHTVTTAVRMTKGDQALTNGRGCNQPPALSRIARLVVEAEDALGLPYLKENGEATKLTSAEVMSGSSGPMKLEVKKTPKEVPPQPERPARLPMPRLPSMMNTIQNGTSKASSGN